MKAGRDRRRRPVMEQVTYGAAHGRPHVYLEQVVLVDGEVIRPLFRWIRSHVQVQRQLPLVTRARAPGHESAEPVEVAADTVRGWAVEIAGEHLPDDEQVGGGDLVEEG